ncbi:hypothetical protein [Desmospora profundinema]|uniref:Uncharacterized protein n=1 Tax=Desmospora profundinema TaxID=1571184 RepID=A0ABU1ISV8_9BACL|nr:hypothetical protein [Desmospora profundinema]MDR6226855.1 hypothetical protein [Desmospora profundinema]
MKTRLCILVVFGLIGMVGCSHPVDPDEGKEVTISPYEWTDREEQAINLVATSSTDVLVYQITPGNIKMDKKIDHYQNGKIKDTFGESSSEYVDDEIWISFGLREFFTEDQDLRQWYIADHGSSQSGNITMVEDQEPDEGIARFTSSLGKEKRLSDDQYLAVGAFVQNKNENEKGVRALPIEDLETLIKENEDVYVLSCKLSDGDW